MDYPFKTSEQLRQQIRSLRRQRGLTQARLGALIGVTQARVVEIEADPGVVSLQQIMQVLQALGADLAVRDLVAQSNKRQPPRVAEPAAPDWPASKTQKGSW